MKNTALVLLSFILLSTPLAATAQFLYTTNNGTITITRYTGPGGAVTIPDTINGLPVTGVGNGAFQNQFNLTGISIPDSVTSIEDLAFWYCASLTNVTILGSVTEIGGGAFWDCFSLRSVVIPDRVTSIKGNLFNECSSLTSVTIPIRVTNIEYQAFYECTSLTNVTFLGNVAAIGNLAFYHCSSLANVTIPGSVTDIGLAAFDFCSSLKGAFFKGNAPGVSPNVFNLTDATVYYLPGTSGWGATFADRLPVLWNPLMKSSGVGPAGFGFNITGTADIPIVVEACTNLVNASWVPLQSRNLTNGAFYFSDPDWTKYPARTYRIRSP